MPDHADLVKRLRTTNCASGLCPRLMHEAADAITRLAERETKLRDILRSLEWNKDPEDEEACCPYCMTLDGELHSAGCKMAEAMAQAAAQ